MYLIVTKGVTGIFVYPVEAESGDLALEKVKPGLSKSTRKCSPAKKSRKPTARSLCMSRHQKPTSSSLTSSVKRRNVVALDQIQGSPPPPPLTPPLPPLPNPTPLLFPLFPATPGSRQH